MSTGSWVRVAAGAIVFCTLMPPLAAGGMGLGLSGWAAIAVASVVALAASWWASAWLRDPLAAAVRPAPAVGAVVVIVGVCLLYPYARMSVYMADVIRSDCAYQRHDEFRLNHSCFSAYAEAARFVREPGRNIYQETAYREKPFQARFIGPLRVDPYHYPPPFLLMPVAVDAVTRDFFGARAVWFAVQSVLFAAVAFGATYWIGGAPGGRALLLLPLVLSAQSMLSGLQAGNYQVTAVSLAVLGCILIASARERTGSALLALTAASKIFPGLLILYVLFSRRWHAVVWTAVWGVGLVALTLAVVGTQPFVDFVQYEVPRISDGRAFPQTEAARTAAMNTGFYGITVKLRWLGATALDAATGRALTSIYGVVLLLVAAVIGWRERVTGFRIASPDERSKTLQIWLALVGLASYRSPFVGFAYGAASTMWLLSLMTARSNRSVGWMFGLVGFAATYVATAIIPSPPPVGVVTGPPAWALWLSLGLQLAMFGVNLSVVWPALTAKRPASAPDPALVLPSKARVGAGWTLEP